MIGIAKTRKICGGVTLTIRGALCVAQHYRRRDSGLMMVTGDVENNYAACDAMTGTRPLPTRNGCRDINVFAITWCYCCCYTPELIRVERVVTHSVYVAYYVTRRAVTCITVRLSRYGRRCRLMSGDDCYVVRQARGHTLLLFTQYAATLRHIRNIAIPLHVDVAQRFTRQYAVDGSTHTY